MQIYTVLWDHRHEPHWVSQPSYLEVSLVWKLQKSGCRQVCISFLGDTGEMERGRGCAHQPMFHENTSMPNLDPAPQTKAAGQIDLFHRKNERASVCCLCSDFRCGCLPKPLRLVHSQGTQKHKPPSGSVAQEECKHKPITGLFPWSAASFCAPWDLGK